MYLGKVLMSLSVRPWTVVIRRLLTASVSSKHRDNNRALHQGTVRSTQDIGTRLN